MSEATSRDLRYMVRIDEPAPPGDGVVFTFAPQGLQQKRGPAGQPPRVPQYVVTARPGPDGPAFDWTGTADDPGAARDEIEAEITARMAERATWVERVTALVGQVEQWAGELGWSTRLLEKTLDDARVGRHRVPALLMQAEMCRVLLEPVGRSTLGTEGVVDLYLMPAYDDIASLYYYGGRWNLHYLFLGATPAATVREVEPLTLRRETFESVLAVMRQHAA